MRSIESRLKWQLLLGSLAVSAALALAVSLLVAKQVRELLDYQLEQVARTLIDHQFDELDGGARPEDPAMHLDVVVWDTAGRLLYRSSGEVELRPDLPSGFSQAFSGPQADAVELHVLTLRSPRRIVQVAQPAALRWELARESALEILVPALLLLGLLSVLIVVTVRRGLQPLRELGEQLSRRDSQSLDPISLPGAPRELQAPVRTLNALLARLQESFAAHRTFIAEAAHELRTPLAVLRLQADNVFHARDEAERREATRRLQQGIERAQHLATQLLELARLEASDMPAAVEPFDLLQVARESLVLHAVAARACGMELALDARGDSLWLRGEAHVARMLLDNLLDNALKHAASGGAVEVEVREAPQAVRLRVRDHGPGIPEALHARVLERFYRHEPGDRPGSGLGLAIVAQAARRLGADLRLRRPASGRGLVVEVEFPQPLAAATAPGLAA